MSRDNFSKVTTDVLAKRVAYLCSNPDCRKSTIGPNEMVDKATSIGIAAHITAASGGGPRFDDEMNSEQRSHIENGIWLCSNCATRIDKDEKKFSTELLKDWKKGAEKEADEKINGQLKIQPNGIPYLEADVIYQNGGRYNQGYSRKNPIIEFNGKQAYDVSDNPIIYWELSWKFNFAIFNNSNYPAYNVTVESVGKEHFTNLGKLPKINNLPPFKNLDLEAKFSDHFEGNSKEADKILRHRIPEKFEDLVLKITYFDDDRNQHTTIVEIKSGEILNSRQ